LSRTSEGKYTGGSEKHRVKNRRKKKHSVADDDVMIVMLKRRSPHAKPYILGRLGGIER
jgi:hypothetical protein